MRQRRERDRSVYAVLIVVVIVLGLGSRKAAPWLPLLLKKNAGDILWALMVFLLCGWLLRRASTQAILWIAALFSISIEFLKLISIPWLDAFRHTTPGWLIFGQGFHWSNIACYLIGIGIGTLGELWLLRGAARKAKASSVA
ncbi:MAG TPA: DUF2809 domain-containing protein [Chthonomonadaceae bacterium]|nr:DUF2809 domain-containing protein [Chthonomonadaceae bacterium]